MRTVRLFTFIIAAVLVLSAWTPAPVFAKPETMATSIVANDVGANVDLVTVKMVKLTITNKTGGVIYITLTGKKFYSFVASEVGKNVFLIEKGNYTATLRASTCGGTLTRKVSGGGSLGTFVCKKR